MGLFVKRYDTGEIVQVKKYIIDLHENEESIWSNEWYGRHVIGSHCEWCEGKETTDEQSNCIKPAVTGSASKSDETIHYEALKDCCNNLLDEVAKGNTPRRQLTGLMLLLNRK